MSSTCGSSSTTITTVGTAFSAGGIQRFYAVHSRNSASISNWQSRRRAGWHAGWSAALLRLSRQTAGRPAKVVLSTIARARDVNQISGHIHAHRVQTVVEPVDERASLDARP